MCNELGVDPLSGGRRGLWDWVGFGDWTFALAVQVVDVCLSTRDRNGGLHEMIDVINAVRSLRDLPSQQLSSTSTARLESNKPIGSISDLLNTTITEQDIIRAIKSLEPLGSGYSILTIGHKKFIRSVPAELDNDSLVIFDSILSTRSSKGFTTHQLLQDSQNWSSERVKDALNKAVIRDSMLGSIIKPTAPIGSMHLYYLSLKITNCRHPLNNPHLSKQPHITDHVTCKNHIYQLLDAVTSTQDSTLHFHFMSSCIVSIFVFLPCFLGL
ncbi:hypothetical protein PSTT_06679 [Puccinia striiformis]|uniref:Uncharacterized protein n=1 Tax=Puccinia striiformis TaxID=27350 RepID=A0A2S4VJ97_9BASI|nr:hypothetical protein PSTT_06679 [Puccinia striiformis]